MPIHEYCCCQCEHRFEALVRSADDARVLACPECGGMDHERLFSVFAAPQTSNGPLADSGGCGRCGDPNGPCSSMG